MLTSEEIDILNLSDKDVPISEIAKLTEISEEKVAQLIEIAKRKREKLRELSQERKTPTYLRVVDNRIGTIQKGTMKVGSQILKQLSEGIYTSPAASLRELISNSHDSDAPEVWVSIDENEVTVTDNGNGMDWSDFDKEFTFISYSAKRLKGSLTAKFRRPIIGFIGIGFVSVSELCDTMCIRSGKENSDIFFEATIDFSKFRRPETFDKEFYEVSEYELVNLKKEDNNIPKEKSFTEIKLRNLRPGFKEIIREKEPFGEEIKTIKEMWKRISEEERGITDLGRFWQMILELAAICPVRYQDDGPVKETSAEIISEIRKDIEALNFRVFLNNIELVKPVVFPNDTSIYASKEYAVHPIRNTIDTTEGRLSFRGYVYSQHGMINPKEYLGIVIRLKNVAVGMYDRNLLGYPSSSNQILRNWISGEIYVDEGLENAMNINRSTFKVANPQYTALQKFIHKFLDSVVFKYALDEYYYGGKDNRKRQKEKEHSQVFSDIVHSEVGDAYKFISDYNLGDYPVSIDEEKKTVAINPFHSLFYRSPKKYQEVLQEVFVLLEIAIRKSNGDPKKLKQVFQEEIEKWVWTK